MIRGEGIFAMGLTIILSIRKKRVLRGVFAANVGIVSKRRPPARRFPVRIGPAALGIALFFLIVGALGALDPNESKTSASVSRIVSSQGRGEVSENFSDYSLMIESHDIPIKDILGLGVHTIMIDPGHGGDDPGTIGKMGTAEKHVTLDIALRLKKRLEQYGRFKVLMTRMVDRTLSLKERSEMANRSRADIFISIHVNSLPKRNLDIIETYYFGPVKGDETLELVRRENEGSNFNINDYKNVIKGIGDTLKLQESRLLGERIQSNLYSHKKLLNAEVLDFGLKRAPFVVLLGTEIPGVLVEVGCMSNKDEERRLNDDRYREYIAQHLEGGVIKYLENKGASE
jgi:N-acetylmuramoyl-L-alanine amidase